MPTVVFELGSSYSKVGISGECSPRLIIQSLPQEITSVIDQYKERLKVYLLDTFVNNLRIKPKDYSILIIENICLSQNIRAAILETCLIDFQFQAASMQPDLFLPTLCFGQSDAIVIDIGEHSCRVLPIVDNRPILRDLKFTNVGVEHCFQEYSRNIADIYGSNITARSSYERIARLDQEYDLVPDLEEARSTGSLPLLPNEDNDPNISQISQKFIDSSFNIILHGVSRTLGIVDDGGGIVGSLLSCLSGSNIDAKAVLSQNIIICGGGASIPGLKEAICKEATRTVQNDIKYEKSLKNTINKLPEKQFKYMENIFPNHLLSWMGGSIFAALKDILVAKSEDETEYSVGPRIKIPDWMSLSQSDWTFCAPGVIGGENSLTSKSSDSRLNKLSNQGRRSSVMSSRRLSGITMDENT